MKGLDTNVLVRYIVQDDKAQFAAAVRAIEHAALTEQRLIIAPIVMCELVWVLESAYNCTRMEVQDILEKILRTAQFEILEKDLVWKAWDDYKSGKGDFADYYLGRRHQHAGAKTTLTFDKALAHSPIFEVIKTKIA